MRRAAAVVLVLAFVGAGCMSAIRPGLQYASDEARTWWEAEGRDKARTLATDLAGEAKDVAIAEARAYADVKLAEAEERLRAQGIDPEEIRGDWKAVLREVGREYQESQQEDRPLDWNLILSLLGVYAAGSAAKGGIRLAMNGKAKSP